MIGGIRLSQSADVVRFHPSQLGGFFQSANNMVTACRSDLFSNP